MTQRTFTVLRTTLVVVGAIWGLYTLLMYLGMPVHQLVYSRPEQIKWMDTDCGSDQTPGVLLCRGSAAVLPFLKAFFLMSSPFLLYVILCLIAFAAWFGYSAYTTGRFSISFTGRPLHVVLAFVAMLWLIGTTFSMGSLHNQATPQADRMVDVNGSRILMPFRRFYEPTKEVYGQAGEQALAELQANYQRLLQRGCLKEIAQTQGGSKVYDMSVLCIQQSMIARVGTQSLLIFLFLLNLLVVGRAVVRLFLRAHIHPLLELVICAGLGALLWVAALWFLAVTGGLQSMLVRGLFIGLPIALFPHSLYWLQSLYQRTFPVDWNLQDIFPFLLWLLLSYVALNFLNVVRPFPIGWDDLGSYLNRPRLLASYGSFIPSMSQFQWEYLTSLGFLLFGFDSTVGSTFAMMINWSAGVLAILVVYVFGRLFFGQRGGLLSAILYYFLPMVGHFSFADMKIDNASFFTGSVAILVASVALWGVPSEDHEPHAHPIHWRLLLIAGMCAAFCFAIKPTGILVVLLVMSLVAARQLGPWGFAGTTFLGLVILNRVGPLNLLEIAARAQSGLLPSDGVFDGTFALLGIACLGYGWYRYRQPAATALARPWLGFFCGALIAAGPWMFYNAFVVGPPSIPSALKASDTTAPMVVYSKPEVSTFTQAPVRYLPDDLALNPDHPACKTSARVEELDRYWGFGTGWGHYLKLPWRQVMNVDGFGYYVTLMPALLLIPLLLLVPAFWDRRKQWLRYLFAGTMVFFVHWVFLANGISWYGVGMFLGFVLFLEALARYAPDTANRWLFSGLLMASILICLVNRLWQFDSQRNLFEYPLGKVTATALREMTIPHYDDIRDSVASRHESMPDRPYTYRIGTFISYFIPRNRDIFPLADHQMGFFNCINQERNHALTLKRLQALGFNGIIFDTNTHTIEKNPNGSLHQKVEAFLNFANDQSLGIQLIVNDPGNGIAYMLLP